MSLAPSVASGGYSADVRLTLRAGACCWRLGQIAPDYIVFDPPASLPPGPAEVILTIDGRDRIWRVELPDGSSTGTARTPIRRV